MLILGYDFAIEVMPRIDTDPGYKPLLRPQLVERTFGWLACWRHACATTNIDVAQP